MSTQISGGLQDTLAQAGGALHPSLTPWNMLVWPHGVLLAAGGSGITRPDTLTSSTHPEGEVFMGVWEGGEGNKENQSVYCESLSAYIDGWKGKEDPC